MAHPRYREQYGLTDDDADVANSFRYAARQAGWSNQQIDQAFQWYKAQVPYLDRMTVEERVASFQDYASARGLDGDTALGWFDSSATALNSGQPLPLPPAPTPEQDRARLAELQDMLRQNPSQYFGDDQAQDELYEILARAEGSAASPAAATLPAGNDRRAAIETMMRQDGGREYWASPALQQEYHSLLSGDGTSEGQAASPADSWSSAGDNNPQA